MFAGSLDYNLRYGNPEASSDEVTSGAQIADSYGFISAGADAYGRQVAEQDKDLSSGQRQWVSLARALIADPRIQDGMAESMGGAR